MAAHIPLKVRGNVPLALTPHGDLLATADAQDATISIWNMRTAARVTEIPHAAGRVFSWSDAGQHLAFAGDDPTVYVWDAKEGCEKQLYSARTRILALAFAPDGNTLAVGTEGRDIQLLDAADGTVKRTLRTQGPYFYRLTFSPDGRKLAVANGTAGGFRRDHRVWNLDDSGSLDLNYGAEAISFSFSADGQRLAIGDAAGMIQLWDLDRRTEVERFPAHAGAVTSIRLLPDDRIISAGTDGTVKIWLPKRSGVLALKGYPNALRKVAFSPDSHLVAVAGLDSKVFVWDAREGHLAGTYAGHSREAAAMAFRRDGCVASAGADQTVRMWNPVSFETQWETSLAPAAQPYWIAFSPDGRRLYVPSKSDTLTVLDGATGQRLNSISGLENVLDGIAVSPDGKLIALCQKVKLSRPAWG